MANSRPSPIRDIRSLKTNLRETAAFLDELDVKLRFFCEKASLCDYLASCGEPQRVVDLRSAARTLRMYAGFLQLGIDAVRQKRENLTPVESKPEPKPAESGNDSL
jgi:hypothetical protein